jgi:hypothetical protein
MPRIRPWTDEELVKLKSMAQRYPSTQIASGIGRPIASVRTKAHELHFSLGMDRTSAENRSSSLGLRLNLVSATIAWTHVARGSSYCHSLA